MALKKHVYDYEEIFKKEKPDSKNVNMVIPPILAAQGWKVGDVPKFDIGDKGTIIITQSMKKKKRPKCCSYYTTQMSKADTPTQKVKF